jgi:hypothetical protein
MTLHLAADLLLMLADGCLLLLLWLARLTANLDENGEQL